MRQFNTDHRICFSNVIISTEKGSGLIPALIPNKSVLFSGHGVITEFTASLLKHTTTKQAVTIKTKSIAMLDWKRLSP